MHVHSTVGRVDDDDVLDVMEHQESLRQRWESSSCDQDGWTALHYAAQNRATDLDSLKILLDSGADVDARDFEDSFTPLHVAVCNGNYAVVKILLDSCANVNAKDMGGESPLHLACGLHRPVSVVEALIASGADLFALNNEGRSPFDTACICGNMNAQVALRAAGGAAPGAVE